MVLGSQKEYHDFVIGFGAVNFSGVLDERRSRRIFEWIYGYTWFVETSEVLGVENIPFLVVPIRGGSPVAATNYVLAETGFTGVV